MNELKRAVIADSFHVNVSEVYCDKCTWYKKDEGFCDFWEWNEAPEDCCAMWSNTERLEKIIREMEGSLIEDVIEENNND